MSQRFEYEQKVWGKVAHLFQSDRAAVSHLVLEAGFWCSRHYHLQRVNQFHCLRGKVVVEQWPDGFGMDPLVAVLGPGGTATVEAGVLHRFVVLEPGEVIEVYWPKDAGSAVSQDDIHRLDVGGPTGNLP